MSVTSGQLFVGNWILVIIFSFLALPGTVAGQRAKVVRLVELQKVIESPGEEIRVINFWATWCAPCIKELPFFERLNQERKDVKVTLVSLDIDLDPNPEKVHRFVQRKKIQSQVLILDERDPNEWIDKIEKEWSGSLPATLVVNSKTGKRKFVERELRDGDLEKLITEVE